MNLGLKRAHAAVALSLVGLLCGACGKDSRHAPSTAPKYGMLLNGGAAPIRESAGAPIRPSAAVTGAALRAPAPPDPPAPPPGPPAPA